VEEFFDNPIYDLEYRYVIEDDERSAREVEFLARELDLGAQSRVLDLACGHGRHVVLLAPRVARVVGFDRTERFLVHLEARTDELGLANVECVRGDMRELTYEGEFDAAYNYFTAWGYYSDEENFDVLVRVRRALAPGGRFLLEMINRNALLRQFRPKMWVEHDDGTLVLLENRFDHVAGRQHSERIHINLESGERKTVSIDHQLPAPDGLVRLFREAGFRDVRAVSAPDGGPLDLDSWRVAVTGTR
jgi:SAM-dependent methyltransferase